MPKDRPLDDLTRAAFSSPFSSVKLANSQFIAVKSIFRGINWKRNDIDESINRLTYKWPSKDWMKTLGRVKKLKISL